MASPSCQPTLVSLDQMLDLQSQLASIMLHAELQAVQDMASERRGIIAVDETTNESVSLMPMYRFKIVKTMCYFALHLLVIIVQQKR